MLVLALADDVDRRAVALLNRLDDVEIAESSPQTVLITADAVCRVRIQLVEANEIEAQIRADPDDDVLLVVNAVLDDQAAAMLEDANVRYIDAAGRRWLRGPTRTKRSSEAAVPAKGKRSLYAASVRLAQLLADHPQEPWTERGLARRGQTTQTTAHRLLGRLEDEALLQREGRGPSTVRRVREPAAMRSWLARQARPRRVTRLTCFVEEPERPRPVGRDLALTGAVAAHALGMPVLTREAIPTVRVSARPEELEDVPEALGGFRTEKGFNLILIADPDRLAFVDATARDDGWLLAPPSRIMLDLFLEPRGEAAADVFLSLWGDREGRS